MKKKKNIPLLVIAASIPFMWALVYCLAKYGFFEFLEKMGMSDGVMGVIITLIANIPVLVFIGYGIYNITTSPSTIPKVKEHMPWDKGSSLNVDKEWREEQKQNK